MLRILEVNKAVLSEKEIEDCIMEFLSDGDWHTEIEIEIYVILSQMEKAGEILKVHNLYRFLPPSQHYEYIKRHNRRQISKGLCTRCNNPLKTKTLCEVHRQKIKEYSRRSILKSLSSMGSK